MGESLRLADLEILGEIGGPSVQKVFNSISKSVMALKLIPVDHLSSSAQECLLVQVKTYLPLEHPNLLTYHGAFLEQQCLCILTDYLPAQSLHRLVQKAREKNTRLSEDKVTRIMMQVCQALKYLHSQKVLHANLKSRNILVSKEGVVKVTDLQTQKMGVLGAMGTSVPLESGLSPPEYWVDKLYENKSDIWQLGCILYEMCTLRPLFKARESLCANTNYDTIPKSYSLELLALYARLVERDVHQRPSAQTILQNNHLFNRFRGTASTTQKSWKPEKSLSPDLKISMTAFPLQQANPQEKKPVNKASTQRQPQKSSEVTVPQHFRPYIPAPTKLPMMHSTSMNKFHVMTQLKTKKRRREMEKASLVIERQNWAVCEPTRQPVQQVPQRQEKREEARPFLKTNHYKGQHVCQIKSQLTQTIHQNSLTNDTLHQFLSKKRVHFKKHQLRLFQQKMENSSHHQNLQILNRSSSPTNIFSPKCQYLNFQI